MSFKKDDFYTLVQQACDSVPEFKLHYLEIPPNVTTLFRLNVTT